MEGVFTPHGSVRPTRPKECDGTHFRKGLNKFSDPNYPKPYPKPYLEKSTELACNVESREARAPLSSHVTCELQEPEIHRSSVDIVPHLIAIRQISDELMSNRVEYLW